MRRSYQRATCPPFEGEAQLEFKTHNPAAGSTLGRVLAVQPDNPVAHAMIGALGYEHKDCTGATEHHRQSLSVIRAQPSALRPFGNCLLRAGQFKEATDIGVFQDLFCCSPGIDGEPKHFSASRVFRQVDRSAQLPDAP
jgi:hypothetical protein